MGVVKGPTQRAGVLPDLDRQIDERHHDGHRSDELTEAPEVLDVHPSWLRIVGKPPDFLYQLDPRVGAVHIPNKTAWVSLAGHQYDPDARGAVHLYVPESYTDDQALPLIVALHGGSGHGADFLWTWLREAKSRGCILLAPTSQGPTGMSSTACTPLLHDGTKSGRRPAGGTRSKP